MEKEFSFVTSFTKPKDKIMSCNVVEFTKPNKVKRSLNYACDIKTIYKQYCKTGNLPLNGKQPIYDENFVNYNDLINSQRIIAEASDYFLGLPSEVKNHYGNSLEKFIKALNAKDEFLVNQGVLQLPKEPEVLPPQSTDFVAPTKVVEPTQTVSPDVNTATTVQ